MKRLQLTLAIIAMSALTMISNRANAQRKGNGGEGEFEVGTMTLNIGAGLGRSGYNYSYYYGYGLGYGSGLGLKAAVERGMWQLGPGVLSLGVEAGGSLSSAGGYKSDIFIAAIRSAYHFGWNVPKLDTYAGLSAGPGIRSYDYYYNASTINTKHDITFAFGAFVGGSYYFSPNIGVNVELGYDITEVQGGIIFKLK